jgi:hypothetical protein
MDVELIQIYSVVEAKSVNELVRLTNLKTKNGWNIQGGMCYAPNNFCEADSQSYPFCQSIYRMEKPKKEAPVKQFVAFPYGQENKTTEVKVNQAPATESKLNNKKYKYNKNKSHVSRDSKNK